MAVAVPIVSKKSVSMIAKIVSAAASAPMPQISPMSNFPRVEKSGAKLMSAGRCVSPSRKARMDTATMLMRSAARTFMTNRTIVRTSPSTNSHWAVAFGKMNWTDRGAAGR